MRQLILIFIYGASLILPAFIEIKISRTKLWRRVTTKMRRNEPLGEIQFLAFILVVYMFLAMTIFIILFKINEPLLHNG